MLHCRECVENIIYRTSEREHLRLREHVRVRAPVNALYGLYYFLAHTRQSLSQTEYTLQRVLLVGFNGNRDHVYAPFCMS